MAEAANTPKPSAWEGAIKAERFARSVMTRYRKEITMPVYRALDDGAATFEDARSAEAGWAPYAAAHYDAVKALLETPAPSLRTVAEKIDIGMSVGFFENGEEVSDVMKVIAKDVRRLAGEAI